MTQEDKQLLLQDLCARLPYGVLCEDMEGKMRPLFGITPTQHFIVTLDNATDGTNSLKFCTIDCVKPYLRPMSSMTEDESAELSYIISEWFDKELFYLTEEPFLEYALSIINYSISPLLFDWLNRNHFDYRSLIEKNLALDCTGLHIYD